MKRVKSSNQLPSFRNTAMANMPEVQRKGDDKLSGRDAKTEATAMLPLENLEAKRGGNGRGKTIWTIVGCVCTATSKRKGAMI